MTQKKEWFDEWFNTLYYHILYKDRDYNEASRFLDKLISYFNVPPHAKFLDLACGKGRHSIYLNEKGFDVTGVDLSKENIKFAKAHENDTLRFDVHDMRQTYADEEYDYVFNLFTSFGYFGSKKENLSVIDATIKSLKPRGKFLIDFLNPYVVINNLVREEDKIIENIHFKIERKYTEDQFIVKNIKVNDRSSHFEYQERVKAIRRTEFLSHFEKIGLEVLDIFGDYRLSLYKKEVSDRLIFIVQKKYDS